ncbi:hypothetical protein K438DRAFT_872321 [Mycena galopus ATCC 62051]|nr:hypothetical protein K438DRAFT_872321 [Mycena galopus ATCC 62051]
MHYPPPAPPFLCGLSRPRRSLPGLTPHILLSRTLGQACPMAPTPSSVCPPCTAHTCAARPCCADPVRTAPPPACIAYPRASPGWAGPVSAPQPIL